MTVRKIFILAILIFGLIGLANAADIAGKWKAEFESQIGVQKYTFDFKVQGDKLTCMASFEKEQGKGEVEMKEIKLNGDDISFVEIEGMDGEPIRVEYKGKISNDEMKLTRQVGEFATEQLVAKRVK